MAITVFMQAICSADLLQLIEDGVLHKVAYLYEIREAMHTLESNPGSLDDIFNIADPPS